MDPVLESCRLVASRSRDVSINHDQIEDLASRVRPGDLRLPDPMLGLSDLSDEQRLAFLFVIDSLNFCYWGSPKWSIVKDGEVLDGYMAMAECLSRAIPTGILDPSYLSKVSDDDGARLFRGRDDARIPLLRQRVDNLRELGRITRKRFRGDFSKIVDSAGGSAPGLVDVLTRNFPHFHDATKYEDHPVFFHKLAQLLTSDLAGWFGGSSYGRLRGLEELTCFADYKIPQVLRRLGVLGYSPYLSRVIQGRHVIPADSPAEVEIRANAVVAVEELREAISSRLRCPRAVDVDFFLWKEGQRKSEKDLPYHLTLTAKY